MTRVKKYPLEAAVAERYARCPMHTAAIVATSSAVAGVIVFIVFPLAEIIEDAMVRALRRARERWDREDD